MQRNKLDSNGYLFKPNGTGGNLRWDTGAAKPVLLCSARVHAYSRMHMALAAALLTVMQSVSRGCTTRTNSSSASACVTLPHYQPVLQGR